MRDGVALEVEVIGTDTHFAFKVRTPDDGEVHSFRVLADLARRLSDAVDDAVVDRTAQAKPRNELGSLDWFFLFSQRWGSLEQAQRGETLSYTFLTIPTSHAVVSEALREFEQRLLLEPDLDEPCFPHQPYSMIRTL